MSISVSPQFLQPPIKPAMVGSEFDQELLAAVPMLRRLALSLMRQADRVDDLVQETLTKAWGHRMSFRPGTNLEAWLVTILKNEFYTFKRRTRREIEDPDGRYARNAAVLPNQQSFVDLMALKGALAQLPAGQRRALTLIVLSGLSYAEAAQVCRVKIGTIKSRVGRARSRLAGLLGADGPNDFGADIAVQAAVAQIHMH